MLRWGPIFAAAVVCAADWTQFRGPNGSGISTSKNVPERFDTQKNLVWKTPLPAGHSSPVFSDDRIFVTGFEGRTLLTICLDRETGNVLWRRPAPRERAESYQPTNG